jgi:hypothetical protein
MSPRLRLRLSALIAGAGLSLAGCGAEIPLQPVNHSPVALSLSAFPTTIGIGDSAIVVCLATDADGDTVVFDWSSDCRLVKKGPVRPGPTLYSQGNTLVVYGGSCATAPLDTGWVSCSARDLRGGSDYAGTVQIIIQQ